jgi:hypothetical protein
MRKLNGGVAVAVAAGLLLSPLQAAAQTGYLSGHARSETKQPYSDYSVRARSVTDGSIQSTVVLDAQGTFKLDGLTAGKFVVELTRTGQAKVICSEGPFEIKPAAAATVAFGRDEISVSCGTPPAAWWLLGAAAAAGVTAGVVAAGDPASPSQ